MKPTLKSYQTTTGVTRHHHRKSLVKEEIEIQQSRKVFGCLESAHEKK